MHMLRAFMTAPAWAAHFHAAGPDGHTVACFDARCGVAPLATSDEGRFTPAPPSGSARRPARTATRPIAIAT